MFLFIKQTVLVSTLLLVVMATSHADPEAKPEEIIKNCRNISANLDYLGRYQDRETCRTHLEGWTTFSACCDIEAKSIDDAKKSLSWAIKNTRFAQYMQCNEGGIQDGKKILMADIIKQLQDIQKSI